MATVPDTRSRDPTAERLIALLRDAGADSQPHAAGRSLLDHLLGTYEITGRWAQPEWIQHAALIHSVYGTEVYRQRLTDPDRRNEIRALAGARAERLAHFFALTPRRLLFAGTHRWAQSLAAASSGHSDDGSDAAPTRDELDELVLIHMANLAEQARAPDGAPGTWLVALRDQAESVLDSEAVKLPLFVAQLAAVSSADEEAGRAAYREGLGQTNLRLRTERMAMAATRCPAVGEPCVWLADAARHADDLARAREWADTARQRLVGLGTSWDKRLSFDEWLAVIEGLAAPRRDASSGVATDPRELYDEVVRQRPAAPGTRRPSGPDGPERFTRYMSVLADASRPGARRPYPGLERGPWWDPDAFLLARELESHFADIRDELLAVDPARFAPESEPIKRTGDWDVVFFHERGRRHDDVCAACPTTTRLIEGEGAMLSAAGLSYLSRMRPDTHIAPHRGPTNLRLRCHLPISVPDGNCAIRVGHETRRWSEGSCLVFDDSFEHEAWNHTSADRLVLIVDIWHPDLSPEEVRLLAGLHRYAAGYARRLDRYWAQNAAARGEEPTG